MSDTLSKQLVHIPLGLGTCRCTALHTHNPRVNKQLERMSSVPLSLGLDFQCTISVPLPKTRSEFIFKTMQLICHQKYQGRADVWVIYIQYRASEMWLTHKEGHKSFACSPVFSFNSISNTAYRGLLDLTRRSIAQVLYGHVSLNLEPVLTHRKPKSTGSRSSLFRPLTPIRGGIGVYRSKVHFMAEVFEPCTAPRLH